MVPTLGQSIDKAARPSLIDPDIHEAFVVAFDHIMYQRGRGLTVSEIAESFGYHAYDLNNLITVGALTWMLLRCADVPVPVKTSRPRLKRVA